MKQEPKNGTRRPPPPPPNRNIREDAPPQDHHMTAKQHLWVLIGLLVFWIGLFFLVMLEMRSWARLLPPIFVVIVIYGAFITRKIIKETKQPRRY